MSFSFNFHVNGDGDVEINSGDNEVTDKVDEVIFQHSFAPARSVEITEDHLEELSEVDDFNELLLPNINLSLYYVDSNRAEEFIKEQKSGDGKENDSNIAAAFISNTDIIPNVYEGGFKVWECAEDLVLYLHEINQSNNFNFEGKNIMEIGCGAGLPGIYALKYGANVQFLDYNWEALDYITIPNVLLNTVMDKGGCDDHSEESDSSSSNDSSSDSDSDKIPPKKLKREKNNHGNHDPIAKKSVTNENSSCSEKKMSNSTADSVMPSSFSNLDDVRGRCHFLASDWSNIQKYFKESSNSFHQKKYDMILTSETIYCPSSYHKLVDLFLNNIQEDGVILVAAKSYYFGVGGSVDSFTEFIQQHGVFDVEKVAIISEGIERVLMKLNLKKTKNR